MRRGRPSCRASPTDLSGGRGESTLSLVRYSNQVVGAASVPDAEIAASLRYLFEVKTDRGAVRPDQLRGHLQMLDQSSDDERLFVVTPDSEEPGVVAKLRADDDRIIWFSFGMLADEIDVLLAGQDDPISERDGFLLRELRRLFEEDGLLGYPEDTVIMAAGRAYPQYLRHAAYWCQAGRSFRPGLRYLGFYSQKTIHPEIARIEWRQDHVPCTREQAAALLGSDDPHEQRAGRLIGGLLAEDLLDRGELQFFLLSAASDPDTLCLSSPVRHDARGAWTQNQRYINSEVLLRGAATTAELA